jgi:hypothetical protein
MPAPPHAEPLANHARLVGVAGAVDGEKLALAEQGTTIGGESTFIFMRNTEPASVPPVADQPSNPVARLPVTDAAYLRHDVSDASGRAERNLRALLTISSTASSVTTEDDLQQRLVGVLARAIAAEQVAILAAGPDGDGRIAAARQGNGAPPVTVNRALFNQAMEERVGLLTRAAPDGATPGQSIVCVPLVARDRSLGALYLTRTVADPFDADDLQFAQAVANVATVSLDTITYVASLRESTRGCCGS